MEHRQNFCLFQPVNQRRAVIVIPQLNVKHMRVLPAIRRHRRQIDTTRARQRQQRVIISLPQRQALLVNPLSGFQLRPEIGGL